MRRILISILVLLGLFMVGCKEQSEGDKYYIQGIKAEQNMQYETAISSFARSLQFNREDAVTWYAKGRCHLLLLMQMSLVDSVSAERDVKIMGNMNKARECFKRSDQWGFQTSSEVDSLQVWLLRSLKD
ncbi:MAG: hypothetical protein K9N06_13980 [Candidatus Cloacimonetes bacterium]|nr:hypothetical protein [Candidatus Cloacimonadota bacterium]